MVLSVLGDELREDVLSTLTGENAGKLRQQLGVYSDAPPEPETLDKTLDEFDRVLRFALMNEPEPEAEPEPGSIDVSVGDESDETGEVESDDREAVASIRMFGSSDDSAERFEPGDDPIADLSRLEPWQLAGALESERPRTISMLLGQVSDELGGETIKLLPEAVRPEVFLQMKDEMQINPALLRQVARATVEKGLQIEAGSISSQKQSTDEKMAGILRSLARKERNLMMEALEQQDQETAERIRDLLYVFEDLARVTDRSLQQILGEVDTPTIAKSLKDVENELLAKVQRNMSQRAWEALAEELELAAAASPDDVDAARKEITQVMIRLDQSGELAMEE